MLKLQKQISSRRAAYFFIITGLLLAAGAIILLIRDSHPVVQPPGTDQSGPSSAKLSADAIANYTVAPDRPKYISIPAIKVPTTRILQLGLTKNDQIAVPGNVNDTGWYDGSAKPGQSGAMFIFGHVSSWQAEGVFYNLKKLKPGDKVTVTNGANHSFVYEVIRTKIYPYKAVDMHEVLLPISSRPGLNLMTCTGRVIKGTSEFDERLVVFTSLVEG